MRQRILLVSTVHPPTDPRIAYKIAPSLARHYEVYCALPAAIAPVDNDPVHFIALPVFRNLYMRVLISHVVVLWKCMRIKPDLVHIFVPELIPLAFLFKWSGAVLVYEVQENLYKKFSIKHYNNARVYQAFFRFFDHLARRNFYCVFAEDAYLKEYSALSLPHAVVHNYASLAFLDKHAGKREVDHQFPQFIYSGVISLERSFDTLIFALVKLKENYPNFSMHLFGFVRINPDEIKKLPGYDRIAENLIFYGYADQKTILKFAQRSIAGIALLKPVADYPDSYTTKLFEYMSLKLPVITSDFPLYRDVVEKAQCGFCISPYDADELFQKMKWLVENPAECVQMGDNGRRAVEKCYNWVQEERILLGLYRSSLNK